MKRIIFILAIMLLCASKLIAQNFVGSWNGSLDVGAMKLRLGFNIEQDITGYKSTMDSPDQGANGIPVTSTVVESNTLTFKIPAGRIEYIGTLERDTIKGIFTQNGQSFTLNLVRGEAPKLNRPQEPLAPFAYRVEDVNFKNVEADITLAGTLTLPEKGSNFPVVILISGSGPQDRNEEILQHKPFLLLADQLTRSGIAVLRYDDRGVASSGGVFQGATTDDFAKDVMSAVEYLKSRKDIDKSKIGLIGHSEGGSIAPMVAADNKDINYIVLLAGPGVRGDEVILLQKKIIELGMGVDSLTVQKSNDLLRGAYNIIVDSEAESTSIASAVNSYLLAATMGQLPGDQITSLVRQITSPWFIAFLRHDPVKYLSRVQCPVLAINGSKDMQVLANQNLPAIKAALTNAGNHNVTTVELANLNHLFQECTIGLPTEYGQIEQTFSPEAIELIQNWIISQTR